MEPRLPVDLTDDWNPDKPDAERVAALNAARRHLVAAAELWARAGRLCPEAKPFPEDRARAVTLFGLTAERALFDALNAELERTR